MSKIKEGDIVGRKSYGKDILFCVKRIIKLKNRSMIAILKGLTLRIEADSYIEDLELIEQDNIDNNLRSLEKRLESRIRNYSIPSKLAIVKKEKKVEESGKILHLDGDTHLSNLKKCSNINTYKQVIFNHNLNNVSIC